MLKKHMIAIIVTSVLSVAVVAYMYSKNYITFQSGLHIVIPQTPTEKYIEKDFQPANVEPTTTDTNLISKVQPVSPSSTDTKEESRLFDDIMKVVETFTPLATVLIPLYLHNKSKKKRKSDE